MKRFTNILFIFIVALTVGCAQKHDPRIGIDSEVGNDSLLDNIVTRPVAQTFNELFGNGIKVQQTVMDRNDEGFLELQIKGFNQSNKTKQFRYRVQWFDENQHMVHHDTNVWLVATIKGKTGFQIDLASPSSDAVDFKMETKKAELIKTKVRPFQDIPVLKDIILL